MKAFSVILLAIAVPAAAQDNPAKPAPVQNLDQALQRSLQEVANGPYKQVTLLTAAGGFTGEVVEHGEGVVLIKIDPEVKHLESNKARMDYIYLSTEDLIGVAFSQAE